MNQCLFAVRPPVNISFSEMALVLKRLPTPGLALKVNRNNNSNLKWEYPRLVTTRGAEMKI